MKWKSKDIIYSCFLHDWNYSKSFIHSYRVLSIYAKSYFKSLLDWREKDLIYSYMLLAGAGAFVLCGVFCVVTFRDEISKWLSGFML